MFKLRSSLIIIALITTIGVLATTLSAHPPIDKDLSKDPISESKENSSLVKIPSLPFQFAEGPATDGQGNIYFSDAEKNRIYKWSVTDNTVSVFRENSGGSLGLFFDKSGDLLAAESGNQRVVSIAQDGSLTVLADTYNSKKLNSPNDLWQDPKGGIYFTDPNFTPMDDIDRTGGAVYYISPDRKSLMLSHELICPNGIAGNLDGTLLYVSDPGVNKIYEFKISPDGTLSSKRLFTRAYCDGMTVDDKGNVYLTEQAVTVYSASGEKLNTIATPERPTNICYSHSSRTLCITTIKSVYIKKL